MYQPGKVTQNCVWAKKRNANKKTAFKQMETNFTNKEQDKSTYFNPLNPKSDYPLISPYNMTPESLVKVMRIKERITREGTF